MTQKPYAVRAVAKGLRIWNIRKKTSLTYLNTINTYEVNQYMDIDVNTRRNLEITETMRDKVKRGSLLWVPQYRNVNGCKTLKQWIEKPLINPIEINKRLYSVKELTENIMLMMTFRQCFPNV